MQFDLIINGQEELENLISFIDGNYDLFMSKIVHMLCNASALNSHPNEMFEFLVKLLKKVKTKEKKL